MFVDETVEVTIDQLCDGITSTLATALGIPAHDHLPERDELATPCLVVEIQTWEEGEHPHTGQTSIDVTVIVYCLVSSFPEVGGLAKPRRAVRTLGAAVTHVVRDNRFGLPISPASDVLGRTSDYAPELEEYEVWEVEFQTTITLGDAFLPDGPDDTPVTVWAGVAPEIGPGNEDDYVKIAEPPEVDP